MQLRPYQNLAVESLFNYFAEREGNPIVAMPTGTGKSVVIAGFLSATFQAWPSQRILILTHVKELIEQDYNKMVEIWPTAPAGIISSSLKRRDVFSRIMFGGIATVKNCLGQVGHVDLILIDECHLLSPRETAMYQHVIGELRNVNPYLKVIGFSATPWRLRQGSLVEDVDTDQGGRIFTHFAIDQTSPQWWSRFLAEGWLVPVVPKHTSAVIDVSNVGTVGGEFNMGQVNEAITDRLTWECCGEMTERAVDRQSWLVFCSGVEHSETAAKYLNSMGVRTAAIHNKLTLEQRNERIAAYKSGVLRALTNNNVLTTGFDHPMLDFIGCLRPTKSSSLWVQMLGRGTRPFAGKTNCLVADFARNARRLGPINDPVKPEPPRPGGPRDVPVKLCEACGAYNHTSARVCIDCGASFEIVPAIFTKPDDTAPLMSDVTPVVERFQVSNVQYFKHVAKKSGAEMLMVRYFVNGVKSFNEFVHLESAKYAGKQARDWWRQRSVIEPPETVFEAMGLVSQLRMPTAIRVWTNKQFPEVLGYEWDKIA